MDQHILEEFETEITEDRKDAIRSKIFLYTNAFLFCFVVLLQLVDFTGVDYLKKHTALIIPISWVFMYFMEKKTQKLHE